MPARKKRSRKKSGATRNNESKSSVLSWAVMAVLLAGFVAFLVHLDRLPEPGENPRAMNKPEPAQKHTGERKAKEHQFDFYTVLPDREVEVIKTEKTPVRPKIKQKAEPEPSGNTRSASQTASSGQPQAHSNQLFQLQVGAFKELNKADAMKARLALLGVESNIQVIRNNNQQMYRVRVGPSTDSKKMERIKAQLKAQNINTFMQRL